jgi:hypothetical protein
MTLRWIFRKPFVKNEMEGSDIWMVFIDNGQHCKWRLDSGFPVTEMYPLCDVRVLFLYHEKSGSA